MTETNPTNESDTIINEIVATLKAGTFPTAIKIFGNNVYKVNSVDRFKETRLSGKDSIGWAGVVNVGVEEFDITDFRVGNILELTILVCVQNKTPATGVTNINKLVAAVKNLLNGDVPSTAEGFFPPESDGEMTERIAWGEPEYDTDKTKPWAFAELPCFISYVTASTTSH